MYDHRLKIFVTVAEAGSFSKAAKELFVSQPALTKHINSLENSLGFQLFNRIHTGVTLTEAGSAFYIDAKKIMELSDDAIARAQTIAGQTKDVIRIGCFSSVRNLAAYILPSVIKEISPNIETRIIEYPGKLSCEAIANGINADIFDIVEFGFSNKLETEGLRFAKIYTILVAFEIPPSNPIAHKEKLTVRDLEGQKFYIPARGNCVSFDRVRDLLEEEVPSAFLIADSGTDSTMIAKCQSEGSILVLFHRQIDHFEPLVRHNPPWDIPLDVGLVYKKNAAPHIVKFVELAQKVFAETSLEKYL